MFRIDGETTIELDGFVMDNGEILVSDADKMGDWEKTKIHITPSMARFLIEQNESSIEKMLDVTIWTHQEKEIQKSRKDANTYKVRRKI